MGGSEVHWESAWSLLLNTAEPCGRGGVMGRFLKQATDRLLARVGSGAATGPPPPKSMFPLRTERRTSSGLQTLTLLSQC